MLMVFITAFLLENLISLSTLYYFLAIMLPVIVSRYFVKNRIFQNNTQIDIFNFWEEIQNLSLVLCRVYQILGLFKISIFS